MARQDILARAYNALESLVAEGTARLSVSEVAKRAGIGRATINQSADDDWRILREDIRSRTREITGTSKKGGSSSVNDLRHRIKELEGQIKGLREQAAKTYAQLIDRIQYYYALAGEAPKMRSEKAKLVKELTSQRKQTQILKSQLDLAMANSTSPSFSGLTIKRIIEVRSSIRPSEIISNFISKLYEYREVSSDASVVDVFLLCGLPLAGGEHWVNEHQPSKPGVSLYIDCVCVSEEVRKLILVLLRKEFRAAIHCVRLRASRDVCITRASMKHSGAEQVLAIKNIQDLDSQFVEIHFGEDFDSIILG